MARDHCLRNNKSKEFLPIFCVIGTGVFHTRPTREGFINVGVNCSPTAPIFMLGFLYAREKVVFSIEKNFNTKLLLSAAI